MRALRRIIPLVLLSSLVLVPIAAHAAWPTDPNVNVPVCTTTNYQMYPTMASDGAGGAYVVWQDYRSGGTADLYLQRLTSSGSAFWADGGIALCTAVNQQQYPAMIPDGSGGTIVTWMDNRGTTGYDVYVQRVTASGAFRWTTNGVAACTAANGQYYPALVSDGAGGAILTWYDIRNGVDYDLYAQRIDSSGVVRWTANGVVLCSAAGTQIYPTIVADGFGGAIIAWQDQRSGTFDVYTQRIDASGNILWTPNGVAVCTATADQVAPVLTTDGSGGAIVAWQDMRNGTQDLYAQRVIATSAVAWTSNGVTVYAGAGGQVEPTIVSDENGGAIVVWTDDRSGNNDLYAQRVNSAGSSLWTGSGVIVCSAIGAQRFQTLNSDGAGGALIAWQDQRSGGTDVYAQHLSATATALWSTVLYSNEPVPLSTARDEQTELVAAPDGAGGLIVGWQDTRNGAASDIYAQRIERFGKLGSPEPVLTSVRDLPNDEGGWVRLAWQASPLDPAGDADLNEYALFRSVPPNQAIAAIASGDATRLELGEVPGPQQTGYLFTSQGAIPYAWEYVTSVTAQRMFASYALPLATTCDSAATGNPQTAFLVVARSTMGGKYWMSSAMSGYSVDNLSPNTPSSFTGLYAAGSTTMHWTPVSAPDLAVYHVHRGARPSFTPDAGNLVAALTNTDLTDSPGSAYVYKVCAVDVHGNESSYATLVPSGTLAVDDGRTTLAFAEPRPMPAHRTVVLEWSLTHDGPVRLSLFDATGRRVRTLHEGPMSAGPHHRVLSLDDESGSLPSGLYLVRLEAEQRTIVRRVALLR